MFRKKQEAARANERTISLIATKIIFISDLFNACFVDGHIIGHKPPRNNSDLGLGACVSSNSEPNMGPTVASNMTHMQMDTWGQIYAYGSKCALSFDKCRLPGQKRLCSWYGTSQPSHLQFEPTPILCEHMGIMPMDYLDHVLLSLGYELLRH